MKLHDLMPNPGSKKEKKRKGQGQAAGQGKTAGRGTKGEGSRSRQGGHLYRQGGNLPFYRRLPFKRGEGFTPPNQVEYNEINLEQLARFPSGAPTSTWSGAGRWGGPGTPRLWRFPYPCEHASGGVCGAPVVRLRARSALPCRDAP